MRSKNLKNNVYLKLSILLSLICFFGINIISNNSLKSFTIDVTSNKLYSVSEGTKNLISNEGYFLTLPTKYQDNYIDGFFSIELVRND